jgi:hypothetical protein
MKTNVVMAFVSALLCAAGVQAQTPSTGGQRAGAGRGPITVAGCLQSGDSSSTAGSTASTADAPGMSGFMLTNVRMNGSATSPSTTSETRGGTTAGSSAGRTAANMPSSLTLEGDAAQLRPHVGHQVEVTGTVAGGRGRNNTGSTATGTTAGRGTGTTATETSGGTATGESGNGRRMRGRGGMRTLRVESVKMIASSCAEK